jgi:hypothetical protein
LKLDVLHPYPVGKKRDYNRRTREKKLWAIDLVFWGGGRTRLYVQVFGPIKSWRSHCIALLYPTTSYPASRCLRIAIDTSVLFFFRTSFGFCQTEQIRVDGSRGTVSASTVSVHVYSGVFADLTSPPPSFRNVVYYTALIPVDIIFY